MSLTEKKELRCKIDTCIWHEQYIWSNKKTITQFPVNLRVLHNKILEGN